MKKVRVGIIGFGNWGQCHAEAFASMGQAEIVAVCDTREERLHAAKERFGVPYLYADSGELLDRDDLDLISVVTAEADHLKPTLKALETGKHVLVEKPVSVKPAEALLMQETAERCGRFVFPGHLLRFEPRYAEIAKAIRDGSIGEPVSMYFKRARPKSMFHLYKRTHPAYVSAVHDLDLAIWYSGSRVKKVRAYGRYVTGADVPDLVWTNLEFANGALAVIQSSWLTPDSAGLGMNDSVEMIGTGGIAQFDNRGTGLQLWKDGGTESPDLYVHSMRNGVSFGALREQLEYACACILQGVPPSYTSFADAVHGVAVLEAIVKAEKSGVEQEL